MFIFALILAFLAAMLLVLGIRLDLVEARPTLKIHDFGGAPESAIQRPESSGLAPFFFIRWLAVINKPLVTAQVRQKLFKNMSSSYIGLTPEEFFLVKEGLIVVFIFLFPRLAPKELFQPAIMMAIVFGWGLPDFWLKGRIAEIKNSIIRNLPDTVDLLGLCVNAGLDFMMALKWVVEKSSPSVLISELNNLLQEINVGKPRREALRDLARRFEMPDLSTFSRTLIQADKMGTSVNEALNMLAEDMRLARFRNGEKMALKAPLKMLFPLLFCIFPVVGILVAGPIMLDFMMNNPIKAMSGAGG